MNNILKDKLVSWSEEKLHSFYNYFPEISVIDNNTLPMWEADENGLYVTFPRYARYYKNDGTIESITVDTNDYNILIDLYNKSAGESIRFMNPVEHSTDGIYEYISFTSPTGKLGIPLAAEYIDTNNSYFEKSYVTDFIDDVAWIINTLKTTNQLFPTGFIGFHNRFKDDSGYYFHGLTNFELSYEEFITDQLEKFKNAITGRIFNNPTLNLTELLNYAELKWKI